MLQFRFASLTLFALLACCPVAAFAGPPPPPDPRFGVLTEFHRRPGPEISRQLDLLQQAGIGSIRVLADWSQIEPQPGRWQWARFDYIVKEAARRGIEVTFTLGYLAPWASAAPNTADPAIREIWWPRDFSAWSAYVRAVAAHFRGQVARWQVWEQPNLEHFRGTEGDFRRLALLAAQAVHSIAPQAVVALPDSGNLDLAHIQQLLSSPAGAQAQAVAVAPGCPQPEDALRPFSALAGEIMPAHPGKQLWLTCGWPQDPSQPARLTRSLLIALAAGADRVFWRRLEDQSPANRPLPPASYEGSRSGLPAQEPPGASGLLTTDLEPKPAYHEFANLISRLADAGYAGYLDLGAGVLAPVFQGRTGAVVPVWSLTPAEIPLPPALSAAQALTLDGSPVDTSSGRLAVGPTPVLLTLPLALPISPNPASPVAGSPLPVAASVPPNPLSVSPIPHPESPVAGSRLPIAAPSTLHSSPSTPDLRTSPPTPSPLTERGCPKGGGEVVAGSPSPVAAPLPVPPPSPDYSGEATVWATLGDGGQESGLHHRLLGGLPCATCDPASAGGCPSERSSLGNNRFWFYFDVDPSFAYFVRGRFPLEITVEARGAREDGKLGFNILYDSTTGYRFTRWQPVPADEQWHRFSFRIEDANFADRWGFDFRISPVGSKEDLYLRRVELTKPPT